MGAGRVRLGGIRCRYIVEKTRGVTSTSTAEQARNIITARVINVVVPQLNQKPRDRLKPSMHVGDKELQDNE